MESKTYFNGLNGLRFIAAIFVFIHHVEQHKFWLDIKNYWGYTFIDNLGRLSVLIFFVLSGFLITYSFFGELEKSGSVDWKNFQIKRALRLYPVYYLAVILSLFVLPHFIHIPYLQNNLKKNFLAEGFLYMFMMPNIARLLPPVMGIFQFWYIGVQEQFYLIWPAAVNYFKNKFISFLLAAIAIKLLIEAVLIYMIPFYNTRVGLYKILTQVLKIWQLLLFEQLAIGALGAFLLFKFRDKFLKIIHHPFISILTLVSFFMLFFLKGNFVGYTVLQAVVALLLIVNLSLNKKFILNLEGPLFNYLGNLSFGIYAYHTIWIAAVIYILNYWKIQHDNLYIFNILLYTISFAMAFLSAALSFRYFEKYFYKFKK